MKHIVACCLALILALSLAPAGALATTVESPLTLGGTEDDACYGVLPLENGNLILSMSSGGGRDGIAEYGNNVHKAWLLCLAPDGSTVWETNFGADRKGGYTKLQYLTLNDDNTFTGLLWYTISQYSQYRQEMTFSCEDGSLLSQGEQLADTQEDSVYRQYLLSDDLMLISESVTDQTGNTTRTYSLQDTDHTEYWKLDDSVITLSNVEGWAAAPQGAVLYGRSSVLASSGLKPTVMLVDYSGRVVWTYLAENLDDVGLKDGIIDSNGRFVASGFTRKAIQTEDGEMTLDHDSFQQLLLCLDVSTGEEIWLRTAGTADDRLPNSRLAEIDGHYILCGSGDSYSNILFETVDQDGLELQAWVTPNYDVSIIGPQFFVWNGELWTRSILNGNYMDIILERVTIP